MESFLCIITLLSILITHFSEEGGTRTLLIDPWRRNVVELDIDRVHFHRMQAKDTRYFLFCFVLFCFFFTHSPLELTVVCPKGATQCLLNEWINSQNRTVWEVHFPEESVIICPCLPLCLPSSWILTTVWTGLPPWAFVAWGEGS